MLITHMDKQKNTERFKKKTLPWTKDNWKVKQKFQITYGKVNKKMKNWKLLAKSVWNEKKNFQISIELY